MAANAIVVKISEIFPMIIPPVVFNEKPPKMGGQEADNNIVNCALIQIYRALLTRSGVVFRRNKKRRKSAAVFLRRTITGYQTPPTEHPSTI
jgi:hypothetical protein